jgi:O-antigen/teichoic acid export membrane protein
MRLSRLSLNSLWLLGSRLGVQLGMAVFTILLARGLGASAFGQYAFIASLMLVGNVLTTFGTDMHLVREIAATDDLSDLSPALLIQLILAGLFIGSIFLSVSLLQDRVEAAALRIYSLSLIPLAFYTVFTTALRGLQRMRAYSLLSVASMLLQVLAAAWIFRAHAGLPEVATALLVVQVLAAIMAALLCLGASAPVRLTWRVPRAAILHMVRASALVALLGILGIVYQRLALLLLPALAGPSQAGWYSAAGRIVEAAKIGHVSVFTALYPAMAQFRRAGDDAWRGSFLRPALLLLAAAMLGSAALWLLAPFLVPLLFGREFSSGVPALRVLAWMLIPYAVNSFLTLAFLARGEERSVLRALGASLLVLLALTAWWAPARGAQGAAWAALGAEALQSVVLIGIDLRRTRVLAAILRPEPVGEPAASPGRGDPTARLD